MRIRNAPEYERRMSFVMPPFLFEAVSEAAASKLMSVNSWLRQACLEQLARSKGTDADVDQRVQQRR
jgi:hypothetical protein